MRLVGRRLSRHENESGMYGALLLGGLLLVGSPAFAWDWADAAVMAGTSMVVGSGDRHREYDDKGKWVSRPATVGSWFGEGFGIAIGLPVGIVSFPVWLGVAAASEKFEAHQAFQLSLLTGAAVYDACAKGGYHAVGAPLARVQGNRRAPVDDAPLPRSKLRP